MNESETASPSLNSIFSYAFIKALLTVTDDAVQPVSLLKVEFRNLPLLICLLAFSFGF